MSQLTRLIKTRCPGRASACHAWLQAHVWPDARLRREGRILRQAGRPREVLSGPFRGMAYLDTAADKALLPRLFGTYERELHPAIEDLCRRAPDAVVVAGAGEGYYAVGLARRAPEATVFAYDSFRWAGHLLSKMIERNGVANRVHCLGLCTPDEVERRLATARRPAMVCDVEGEELMLLDPVAAPVLARTAVLVELHDEPGRPIEPILRKRFRDTHSTTAYETRPRTLADFPERLAVPPEDALWAIDEQRLRGRRQRWLYLTPHSWNDPS